LQDLARLNQSETSEVNSLISLSQEDIESREIPVILSPILGNQLQLSALHVDGDVDAEAISMLAHLESGELRPSNSQSRITVKSRKLN
jgi:hypothetical protein